MSEANDEYPRPPGSAIQETLLRILVRQGQTQVDGYGKAKWLSAARALSRRGLAFAYRTGHYSPTNVGKKWVAEHPQNAKVSGGVSPSAGMICWASRRPPERKRNETAG